MRTSCNDSCDINTEINVTVAYVQRNRYLPVIKSEALSCNCFVLLMWRHIKAVVNGHDAVYDAQSWKSASVYDMI